MEGEKLQGWENLKVKAGWKGKGYEGIDYGSKKGTRKEEGLKADRKATVEKEWNEGKGKIKEVASRGTKKRTIVKRLWKEKRGRLER